ncbi:MAG: RHS repeat-associated core domain-containing protein, partial [Bacteroidota bacterium]
SGHSGYEYFDFPDYVSEEVASAFNAPYYLLGNGILINHAGEYTWDLGTPLVVDDQREVLTYKITFTITRFADAGDPFIFKVHNGTNFVSFNGGQTEHWVVFNHIQPSLPFTREIVLDVPPTAEELSKLKTVLFNLHGSGMVSELYAEMTYEAPCPPPSCEPTPEPCSPEVIAAQLATIAQIKANADDLVIENLSLPTNLVRVLLCDGTVLYLLEHELAILQGNFKILQWIWINEPTQTFTFTPQGESTPDAFAMRLYYEEEKGDQNEVLDGAAQENGNISNVFWQARGRQVQRYGYNYDELDRLKTAIYKDRLPDATWANDNKYTVSDIHYDKNGNLLQLARKGLISPCPGTPQYGFVDILLYQDYDGNQVGRIVDAAPQHGGVRKNINGLIYDPYGNLGFHSGKDITNATYNHLNLPQQIEFAGHQQIEWIYDTAGRKWGKIVKENGTILQQKEYIGAIEYTNGHLEAIYHPEGRVTGSTFEYVIRDHLGNSRVYFSDLNHNGKIEFYGAHKEVIQEQHYYPFGMPMEGEWAAQVGPETQYQYNGKELNEEFGLDWLDYGARFYDAAIGRWSHVDPLSETYGAWSP